MAMPDLHRPSGLPKTLNDWAVEIALWRERQGFYQPLNIEGPIDLELIESQWEPYVPADEQDPPTLSMTDIMLSRLMLVTTEVAEAAEAVRHGDYANYVEELADTFIRLLDITGTQDIDIDAAIAEKMEKNRQRPRKHGKRA